MSDIAAKEYSIEQALDKMESEWKNVNLEVIAYKCAHFLSFIHMSNPRLTRTLCVLLYRVAESQTYVIRGTDEIVQQLDDHIVMTQSMSFSPLRRPLRSALPSGSASLCWCLKLSSSG